MGRRSIGWRTFSGIAVSASAVGIGLAGRLLRDDLQRERLRRQLRIWRLTARNGFHWLSVQARAARADEDRRAELDAQFAVRTATDVANELGNMKGLLMKVGQLMSFIAEGLPDEVQEVLATLQQDAPPMAPTLAAQVVRDELGHDPAELFLDWQDTPVAAASVGQVHRAVLPDGREVAVKVQYPGVGDAIRADLANVEVLYGLAAATTFKGLDTKGMIDELTARILDELDYTLEASNQSEFSMLYRNHPFIHIPEVVGERSTARVLTSEWAPGMNWAEFEAQASAADKQRSAEVLFRFVQGAIHRHGIFNGDPHPGNYRFHRHGPVTFLDFGLVKRWSPEEWSSLQPVLDAVIDQRVEGTVAAMTDAGFLRPDHGLSAEQIYASVSVPYRAYFDDTFTFSRAFTAEALNAVFDLRGPHGEVIRNLRMPPSFMILNRVVWGVSALLGRLGAHNHWRGILDEYRTGAPPATELGEAEHRWSLTTSPPSTALAR